MWLCPISVGHSPLQYKGLTQAAYIVCDNELGAKMRADHTKLVSNCHVSDLLKVLHLFK